MTLKQLISRVERLEQKYAATAREKDRPRFDKLWMMENRTPAEQEELKSLGERIEPNWCELEQHMDWYIVEARELTLRRLRNQPVDRERKKRHQRFKQLQSEGSSLEDPEYEKLMRQFGDERYHRMIWEREQNKERMETFGYVYFTYEGEELKPEEQSYKATYFDAADQPVRMTMIVYNVQEGTDAEFLEVRPGDEIVSVDGETMTSVRQFTKAVCAKSATNLHTLSLRRGSELPSLDASCGPFGAMVKMVPEGIPWENYPVSDPGPGRPEPPGEELKAIYLASRSRRSQSNE